MKKGVSVVIPVYNVELYIADCIRSVLSQTRRPEEIIVVDDCSSDRTAEIVQGFASEGVRLIRTPKNGGSGAARNLGIQAASHELIALQDGDDLWLENHCEIVVPLLEQNPKAALAFSATKVFQDEDWIWSFDLPDEQPVDCFLWCAPCTRIPQMNVIVRREILLSEGAYNETLRQAQDYDLFLRLSYKHPFICTRKITTLYRRHSGSITTTNRNRSYHYLYSAQKAFWDIHRSEMSQPVLLEYQKAVAEHWLTRLKVHFYLGEWGSFDFHLSQHHLIPEAGRIYRQWHFRRQLIAFHPLWKQILRTKQHFAEKRLKEGACTAGNKLPCRVVTRYKALYSEILIRDQIAKLLARLDF